LCGATGKLPRFIVDLPSKHGDFPVRYVSLPGSAGCFEGTYAMLADDEDVLEISRLTGNKQYTDKTLGGRTRLGWTPKTRSPSKFLRIKIGSSDEV